MGMAIDEVHERRLIANENPGELNNNCDIDSKPHDSICKLSIKTEATNRHGLELAQWKIQLRKMIIFMTICSTLVVGLLVNGLQLILLVALRFSDNPKWRWLIKKINGKLLYVILSQPIWLISNWSNFRLNIYLDNIDLIEETKNPLMAVVIPNHTHELDYMICFALADQLGNLGCYKSMSKDELKFIPVIGWSLWMSDMLFVKRSWKDDRSRLGRQLNELLDYEQMVIGVFAEGTRWTKEKHDLSVEFAKSKGLTPLSHHLIPRTKGFNYIMRHYLRDIATGGASSKRPFKLINMQFIMPENPSFADFLDGKKIEAHVYCEEVEISDGVMKEAVESVDEDHCPKLSELLVEIYRRKDKIVDEFYANGRRFKLDGCKNPGQLPVRQKLFAKLSWFLSFSLTWLLIVYLAFSYFAGSIMFWTILFVYFGGGFMMLKRIERESKPKPLAETTFNGHKFRLKDQGLR